MGYSFSGQGFSHEHRDDSRPNSVDTMMPAVLDWTNKVGKAPLYPATVLFQEVRTCWRTFRSIS